MSKALKTVGTIVAGVALVATGVGAIGGIALATQIGAVAGVVGGVLNVAAQITAPKPVARGSITSVVMEAEPPRPYMVGESYSAGVLRYQTGYGPTLDKVPNPYMLQVKVFSGVGPVEALVQEQFEFKPIGSYYTGFYDSDTQLGARPEATALVPPYGAAPGWTSASKLSGHAAIASNYKFDKKGKVYARGAPPHGAIWKGEKVYDPRLDSTYPGGSGSHRLGDETTYTYTANPALHTGTYAYGRYENGQLIFGLGVSAEGIDWAAIVDWANDCDANSWEAHGTLWEGGKNSNIESQRVQNMDDLCAAGGARWLVAGALLSFDWQRPRVPLATLTDDDWLEAGASLTAVQTIRDRMNGVRPQYISPANNWEQITADEIIGSTYRTEDGQPLTQTWPLNLVKANGQAGELGAYALVDSREIGPITVNVQSEWRFYKPGETLTIDSELLGYTGQAVIISRDLDPETFAVKMTFKTETPAKHDFALGKVAVPPPTPVIGQTAEEQDSLAYEAANPVGYDEVSSTQNAPSGVQYTADYNGTLVAGQLPDTLVVQRFFAGDDVSTLATWSIFDKGGITGVTITVVNGVVTIPDGAFIPTFGQLVVRSMYNSITVDSVILVQRYDTASPAQTDTFVIVSSFTGVSSTTKIDISGEKTIKTGAAGTLDFSGTLAINAPKDEIGLYGARMRWQYKPVAGSYSDVGGADIQEVEKTEIVYDSGLDRYLTVTSGSINTAAQITGLSADTEYVVRLMGARDNTTPPKTITFGGECYIEGS